MRTPPRPAGTTATEPTVKPVEHRPRFFGLSLTQLVATAFAAITATVIGSYLGVAGTVVGAAVAAVTSAVANAVYGTSIRRTRDTVKAVVPSVVPLQPNQLRWRHLPPTAASEAPTESLTAVPADVRETGSTVETPAIERSGTDLPPSLPTGADPRPTPSGPHPGRRLIPWRGIAVGSIAVFLAIVASVTVVELIAGRPLSDLLRGDRGSGTSLFDPQNGASATTPTPAPTPTVTVTVTPTIVTVTPTQTVTAPAATVSPSASGTASPSGSVTGSPSASASTSPSGAQLP